MELDILHITTSHRAEDNRIYFCEAVTLHKLYKVEVCGLSPRKNTPRSVPMAEVPNGNILSRMIFAYKYIKKRKPKAVHLHDPEMIFVGLMVRMFLGIKVIYDVHEDYELKFLTYKGLGKVGAKLWWFAEKNISRTFNGIICADSHIRQKFKSHKHTLMIGNFPPVSLAEEKTFEGQNKEDAFKVCYVGTIHELRGLKVACEAIEMVAADRNVELHIVGDCNHEDLLSLFNNTDRVTYHGRIPWDQLHAQMKNFDLGLALFQPVPAFTYYPGENVVKLFEYAALGIPYLISDFPKLKDFVSSNGGGIALNPMDVKNIAKTIELLQDDTSQYTRLSKEGTDMVKNKFNWEAQKSGLIGFYQQILN